MTIIVKNDWNCIRDISECSPDCHGWGEVSAYGDGEAPTHRAHQKEKSVVDPVRNHDTERDQASGEGNEESAQVWTSTFRLPGRDRTRDHAVTHASDYSPSHEQAIVEACSLHDCAYDHDKTLDVC